MVHTGLASSIHATDVQQVMSYAPGPVLGTGAAEGKKPGLPAWSLHSSWRDTVIKERLGL